MQTLATNYKKSVFCVFSSKLPRAMPAMVDHLLVNHLLVDHLYFYWDGEEKQGKHLHMQITVVPILGRRQRHR